MNDLQLLIKRTSETESEVKLLQEKVKELEQQLTACKKEQINDINDFSNDENCSTEVAELLIKNIKLKHRLAILERAIEEEKKKCSSSRKMNGISMNESIELGFSLRNRLLAIFTEAVTKAFPDIPEIAIPLTHTSYDKFGDYQCNAAMPISQLLKSQGIKKNPREVATLIIDNLPKNDLISRLEIAGPGFINVWLDRNFGLQLLTKILKDGVKPPPLKKKLRVVVDFSSPNIAKEMHVGHLRSTIIGDSICRLLEFLGHDVLRLNHIGDWGTQFGMLIAHMQDKFPNYLTESPGVSDLQTFYKESKSRFDEDEEFKKRAYACVVKLQKLDPDYIKAWNLICDASRKEFQKVYQRLDVQLVERGESFYNKYMEEVVKFLEKKGLLEEDEGRKVMFGLEEGQIPLTITKSDGGFTYDTSDMAAVKHRVEQEHADWIIYVVDNGQSTHFQVIRSCAKKAGILPDNVRFDFVGFGVVLGEDKKKFKSRSGDTVRLVELLDEGVRKARETLLKKERHSVLSEEDLEAAQNSVAYGCIKYSDLSHNRIIDYVFSFDKMLEDKGNTAVYLLYAYTRICSIARNANISSEQIRQAVDSNVSISLEHEKEWKLAKTLLKFEDVVLKITQDLYLHQLCEFVYDIATTFTEFYDSCYCIEKDSKDGEIKKIHMGRLLLCEVTAIIMKTCFDILGLKPVSRM